MVSFVVIVSVTGEDETSPEPRKKNTATKPQGKKNRPKRKVYEVKEGDSLTAIAEKTGTPVDRIEALNPRVDPQALTVGQKLKLR